MESTCTNKQVAPVGHNWKHHGAETDLCPCCSDPDEAFIHLLGCKGQGIVAVALACIGPMERTLIISVILLLLSVVLSM